MEVDHSQVKRLEEECRILTTRVAIEVIFQVMNSVGCLNFSSKDPLRFF